MIVTRAPLRLSIGGGGTDLPFYSSKFGGLLTTAAIDKYIYIILKKRDFYDEFLLRYSKTEVVRKVEDIQHSRIKAALEYLNITDPVEITSIADVPAETGLGSSSVYLVALLKALHCYRREDVSSKKLAEEAAHIEMEVLKEPVGKQDPYASAFGGLLNLEIDNAGSVISSPIDIPYSTFEELENNCLLFSTGLTHSAKEVISDQKRNLESDKDKMGQMHVIKDIGKEIKCSLEKGDLAKFGKWLNVHWETKKRFSSKMSTSEIDKYYDTALKNGALGGKIVGAGGGGFLLFYCENNKKKLREALAQEGLKELPFRFNRDGCKLVYHN